MNKLNGVVRHQGWLLVALLLLATALRFYRIDAQSLWYDEGNSARIAERSVRLILEGAAGDIHPPLYYLLLKVWRTAFGSSETGLRALSALCGVATVGFTFLIGREWFNRRVAVFAALGVALSPFSVYYSQETRMYALLALAATASTWALGPALNQSRWSIRRVAFYVITTVVGLYTQYAYPFVMLAQGLCFVWANARPLELRRFWGGAFIRYVRANIVALILFAPWLPIALRQIRGWTVAAQPYEVWPALLDCLRWITVGRTLPQAEASLPMLVYAGFALIALLPFKVAAPTSARKTSAAWFAFILFALPLALLFVFKLYRDAYLKFLVVCVPPLALLIGQGAQRVISAVWKGEREPGSTKPVLLSAFIFLLLAALPWPSLRNLYFNTAYARDDYRGIAHQLQAEGRPDDALLFLAPNQWEVFTYYWPDVSKTFPLVYRPLNEAAVDRQMREIVQGRQRLFVLYYAEREADPGGWYERWLAEHAFKADQHWVGNIRLAVYHAPATLTDTIQVHAPFGTQIQLVHVQGPTVSNAQAHVGDVVPWVLQWRALAKINSIYKVFVHIGPKEGAPAAQNDGEPVDGWRPTLNWKSNDVIDDPRAVWIKPGTPPGRYSIFVGVYDPATGQRLALPNGADRLAIGEIEIIGSLP